MFWSMLTGRRIPYELRSCKPKCPPGSLNGRAAMNSGRNSCVPDTGCSCSPSAPATAFAWGDGCKFRADRAARRRRQGRRKGRHPHRRGRHEGGRPRQRGAHRSARRGLRRQAGTARSRRRSPCAAKATSCTSKPTLPQNDDELELGKATNTPTSTSASRCRRALPVEAIDSSGDAGVRGSEGAHAAGQLRRSRDPPHRRARRRRATARATSRSTTPAACACATARATSRSTTCAATSTWCSDSSGDIHIEKVAGNVKVEQDSSGGIRVEDVKGSVDRGLRQLGRHLCRAASAAISR